MKTKFKKGLAALLTMAMVVTLVEPIAGGGYSAQAADETVSAATNAIENDDGTFEGNEGNISLYSPEAAGGKAYGAGWASATTLQKVETEEGTKVHVTSNGSSNFDSLYIKVDSPVKANQTYRLSMDLEAQDDSYTSGSWAYWICDTTADINTLTSATVVSGESITNLFKKETIIEFVPNADSEYFYLAFIDNGTSGVTFNFTIDNIKFEKYHPEVSSIEGDDGTFEGNAGNISLYTAHVISGAEGNGWSTAVTMQKEDDAEGTKVHVTSGDTHSYNYLYVKFDVPIKAGNEYTINMDLTALDEQSLSGTYGYWVLSPEAIASTEKCVQFYKGITAANLFKQGATFTFTSNADYDYFYLLLRDAKSGVTFNFTLDNITLTSKSTVDLTENTVDLTAYATDNANEYALSDLKIGTKYTLTVTADSAPTLVIQNNDTDGIYDGTSYYKKTKEMTADVDAEGNATGTYSVTFEIAPVDSYEVVLQIEGATYTNPILVEEANIEISNQPAKSQIVIGGVHTLTAVQNGLVGGLVSWNSSNDSVATVSARGELTAIAEGKTEITVSIVAEDGTVYEDYFELYVVNEALADTEYGLISDADSKADFALQIPTGEEINILQISDTQIIGTEYYREGQELGNHEDTRWGTENAWYENCEYYVQKTLEQLSEDEMPHLIVLAGDNTYGKFDDKGFDLDKLIQMMDEICEEKGIYWTFVFGNHDKESDIGIESTIRKYAASSRCLYAYRDISGDSNMSVAIKQDGEYKQVLYMFDTHSTGTGDTANRVDEYATLLAGIYDSQKAWFEEVAQSFDNSVTSLVYMHIAFEEYARTFAEKYDADYATITTQASNAYVTYNYDGDMGELHEKVSIWDDNTAVEGTDFYNMLVQYDVDGVFCGHNHQNNYSVVTEDDIRLTFGLKSSTYDAYYPSLLGGTLATTNEAGLNVEHKYVVDRTVEDFNAAGPYGINEDGSYVQMKTSSMVVEWGDGFHVTLTDDGNGGQAVSLTTRSSGNKYFAIRVPEIVKGRTYKLTYKVKSSDEAGAATQATLNVTSAGMSLVGDGRVFTDQTMEYTFKSTTSAIRPDVYVSIWFWNLAEGEVVTFDDFTFEEIPMTGDATHDYLLGIAEGCADIDSDVEDTVSSEYVAGLTGALGAKSYRLWMHFSEMFTGYTESNGTYVPTWNEENKAAMHNLIDLLTEQGVEHFIAMTDNYILLNGTGGTSVPEPGTAEYEAFIAIQAACFKAIAEEFPEIMYFEPGNEPDVENGQYIHKEGYDWANRNEEGANAEYLYTADELAQIVADICYSVNLAVKKVNVDNQVVLPALCGYDTTPEFLSGIYEVIKAGTTLSKDTKEDNYFQILAWHPYLMSDTLGVSTMDENWVAAQKAIYQVAIDNGDEGKPVWFTEMGFSDNGEGTEAEQTAANNMTAMLQLLETEDLSFVESVYMFRLSNLTGDDTQSNYEDNIGLFYSVYQGTENAGMPKPMTYALFSYLYGEDADASALEQFKPEIKPGDFNQDYTTDIRDLVRLKKYLNDNSVLIAAQADLNGDGVIDDADATELRNALIGKERQLEESILNDDGTFEGNTGNISLLSPHLISGAEGYGWAADVKFERVSGETGTAIAVTSTPVVEGNTYDYLYIKVETPIKKDCQYSVTMDVTALDESYANGGWGYWVLSPEAIASTDKCIQFWQAMSATDLFKTDASFTFTSNGDYDYFYILLREAEVTPNINFNITVDNIEFADLGYPETQSITNDDGTFEGNSGYISLSSADATSGSSVQWSANVSMQKVDDSENVKVKVTSDGSHSEDYLYVKFDTPVKAGCEYTVTLDLSALDDIQKQGAWGYFVCGSDAVVSEANCLQWYQSISDKEALFGGGATFSFTPSKDDTCFYFVLREATYNDTEKTYKFNFTIDNIKLTMQSVLNDDGTFEGNSGTISLYAACDVSSASYAWAKDLVFSPMSTEESGKILVEAGTGSNDWDVLLVKFDEAITSGKTYQVSMDLTAMDDEQVTGGWYYAFIDETGNRESGTVFKDYTSYAASTLFGEETATFTFTATKDCTSFCMLFFENTSVLANYTIDNITFTEVTE